MKKRRRPLCQYTPNKYVGERPTRIGTGQVPVSQNVGGKGRDKRNLQYVEANNAGQFHQDENCADMSYFFLDLNLATAIAKVMVRYSSKDEKSSVSSSSSINSTTSISHAFTAQTIKVLEFGAGCGCYSQFWSDMELPTGDKLEVLALDGIEGIRQKSNGWVREARLDKPLLLDHLKAGLSADSIRDDSLRLYDWTVAMEIGEYLSC